MSPVGADAFVQRWGPPMPGDMAWVPAVGSSELIDADGFCAAVNARLAERVPEMVVLSDGFGQLTFASLGALLDTAASEQRIIRAGVGDGMECSLVAAPGPVLAALGGLHPGLRCWYWADELLRHAGEEGSVLHGAWLDYDDHRRQAALGATYYAAIEDLGTLETGQRPSA